MTVASFKVCIELSRSDITHLLGKFEAIATDTSVEILTSDYIEQFIRSIVSHDDDETEVDPTVIKESIRGIRVPMSIADP